MKNAQSFTKVMIVLAVGFAAGWALSLSYEPAAAALPQTAKDRALPASASVPPEIQNIAEEAKQVPEPPKGQPSLQQLEQLLSRMPEAAQRMKNAKAGVRPSAGNLQALPGWWDRVNPFHAIKARAQTLTSSSTSTSLTSSSTTLTSNSLATSLVYDYAVDHSHQASVHTSNLSSAGSEVVSVAYGTYRYNFSPTMSSSYLWGNGLSLALSDGSRSSAWSMVRASIPADAYYVVSARFYSYAPQIKLATYNSGYQVLRTFPTSRAWVDYPWIVYLRSGYHYFYFAPVGGSAFYQGASVKLYK